jgi:hypothetical protein
MSITCVCPNCSEAVTFTERPIAVCAKCGAAFPENLKESLNGKFKIERPALLTLFLYLNYFIIFVLGMMFVFTIVIQSGSYVVNNEPVTRQEFIHRAFPPMGLIALVSLFLINGLRKNKYWTRKLMMALPLLLWAIFFVKVLMSPVFFSSARQGVDEFVMMTIMLGFWSLFGWWYLYRKKGTVAYYREAKFDRENPRDEK